VEAAPGEHVRVYDPARTAVDLMRIRHRIGEPTALAGIHRYLRRHDARPGELLRLADALGVYGPVLRALDVASAGSGALPDLQRRAGGTSTCRTGHELKAGARKNYSPCTSWNGG